MRDSARLLKALPRSAAWLAILVGAATALAQQQPDERPARLNDRQLLAEFERQPARELVARYFQQPLYPLFAIRRLIDLGDVSVAPAVRDAFARTTDSIAREFLAATLVSFQDADPRYWAYLEREASRAAASDVPCPVDSFDHANPPAVPGNALIFWAQSHDVEITAALRLAAIEMPAAIEALGEAGDPRALKILLRGLRSPDCYVVSDAAFGLARLHDIRAVDELIQAAQTNIQEVRLAIAKALLNFDSAQARNAAESLIDDPDRLRRWRAEVEARSGAH
jgi:hypothetical protein